jgi:membrane protein DedA with SNARE-associated domain
VLLGIAAVAAPTALAVAQGGEGAHTSAAGANGSEEAWRQIFGGDFDPATTWLPGLLFLATFVSEDLACVGAGLLVAQEVMPLTPAVLSCAAGILVGDLGLYAIGRAAAAGLLRWRWARERMPKKDGRLARAFRARGVEILFASRFLPGSRLPVFLAAGALSWPLTKFVLILAIAGLVWTPILVYASVLAGAVVADWIERYGGYAWLAVPALLLLIWAATRTIPRLFSWRGRRELVGGWERWRRWEYWPIGAVYAPVVCWLVVLALRYRTFAVFTACNPGIPQGGLVLESKGDILDQLVARSDRVEGDLRVDVPRYARLEARTPLEERVATVAAFLETATADGGSGRVVLKPDVGERGAGVAIVRGIDAARTWLREHPVDALVQEFAAGEEYGVVWHRPTDAASPSIRSIAHKVPPGVVGDGTRTLEELILADSRHVAMAGMHRAVHAESLDRVPDAGERVALGELGTHARGAMFRDARSLRSPALEDALSEFMDGVDGLDFGRFDVRVETGALGLAAGDGIRILEFNGVTGEPAHIYHPGFPLWAGLRDLCAHWSAACRVGAANVAHGRAEPAGPVELLRLVRAMRSAKASGRSSEDTAEREPGLGEEPETPARAPGPRSGKELT